MREKEVSKSLQVLISDMKKSDDTEAAAARIQSIRARMQDRISQLNAEAEARNVPQDLKTGHA